MHFKCVQCGQGSTDDELSPAYISSLGGIKITGIAAGLWHTMFISDTGDVYSCGGNQFGQLGTGGDQAEVCDTSYPLVLISRFEPVLPPLSQCAGSIVFRR